MNETASLSCENGTHQPPCLAEVCFVLPDPNYNMVMARHASNLVTAVINGFCSPLAVMANLLVVFAIARNSALHTPPNVLLACLALSDLLVGLVVQPCYVVFRLLENIKHFVPCALRILYSESFWVCYGVSFLTLSAISFERYIALRLHLRYKELVTSVGALKVAVAIWILDILLTFLEWIAQSKRLRSFHVGLLLLCLVVTLATHVKIFLILRRHQRQINSFHVNRTQPLKRNIRGQNRLAVSVAYIVVIYVTCNIPVLIATTYLFAGGHFSSFNVFSWTETIAFLNSLINPIICCCRNREIRLAIVNIVASVIPSLRKLPMQVDFGYFSVALRGSNKINRGLPQEIKIDNLTNGRGQYCAEQ